MLAAYSPAGACLVPGAAIRDETIWIDLVAPTREEEAAVERALGIAIPTRDEAREIEASSRLYRENGAAYMTAYIVYNADADRPGGATLTFVLAGSRLVTIRYHEPKAFPRYAARAAKGEIDCASAAMVMIGLIESIVDRAADVMERTQDQVEAVGQRIFGAETGGRHFERQLDVMLRSVGRQGDITARLEESLFSLERLLGYLAPVLRERGEPAQTLASLESEQRDVRSLAEQMRFLTDRITFLLEATLGAISIQQNRAVRVFSLLAVTLMPPTLVGAIYGMNFKHVPELDWIWGYPMALGMMVLAALLPYLYFRRKGWI
jgi:magnesium transporter